MYRIISDGACKGNPGPMFATFRIDKTHSSQEGIQAIAYIRNLPLGQGTNNRAEYLALLKALELLQSFDRAGELEILTDSQLLVGQLRGTWKITKPELQVLRARILNLLKSWSWQISWVPRRVINIALNLS